METGNTGPARRRNFRNTVLFTCSAYPELHRSMQSDGLGINISDTGTGDVRKTTVSQGRDLNVALSPDAAVAKAPVYAEVVWVRQEEDRYRTGLKFLV